MSNEQALLLTLKDSSVQSPSLHFTTSLVYCLIKNNATQGVQTPPVRPHLKKQNNHHQVMSKKKITQILISILVLSK